MISLAESLRQLGQLVHVEDEPALVQIVVTHLDAQGVADEAACPVGADHVAGGDGSFFGWVA